MESIRFFKPYRFLLWGMALLGFLVLNTVFVYYAVLHPGLMVDALQNPISAVFLTEAFLLMGFMAWVIKVSGFTKPGWVVFLVLTMLGSLAFSIPAWLLWQLRKQDQGQRTPSAP